MLSTVKRNFYVDDCLKSLPSVSVAIARVNNLHALLARGGFRLTKWVGNSQKKSVLSRGLKFVPISKESDEFSVKQGLGKILSPRSVESLFS